MNKRSLAAAGVLILAGAGLTGLKLVGLDSGGKLAAQGTIEVSLVPGSAYIHKVRFGLFPMNLPPQMAMWIETDEGRYVDTIYVTGKAGGGKWSASGGSRRPESLPVWSHARSVAAPDGSLMPDKAHPVPDAVSGATAKAAFARTWALPAGFKSGTYRIRVELNSSYDWNEAYPDKLPKSDPRWSEVNGQPSIVWEAKLEISPTAGAAEASLAPVGTGALRGEDGGLRPGLDGLGTAKEIAASIEAKYRP